MTFPLCRWFGINGGTPVEFIIYGMAGKSIVVDVELNEPFEVHTEGIDLRGVVESNGDEFEHAAEALKSMRAEFRIVDDIELREFVFRGEINGDHDTLPAEPLDEFARRFLRNNALILSG